VTLKPPEKGVSTKARFEQKRDDVLVWLLHHGYSTIDVLKDLLGVKNLNFFYRLRDNNYIYTSKTVTVGKNIWMLTRLGYEYALQLVDFHVPSYSRVNPSHVRHNIALQIYLLENRSSWESFVTDRLLEKTPGRKIPDAILANDGGRKTALEIELSHKNKDRIFQAYHSHLLSISKGAYDHVVYVFPRGNLTAAYRAEFSKDVWPQFSYNQRKRGFVRLKNGLEVAQNVPNLGKLFTFKTHDFGNLL